ncbi:MAG: hypothetical protein ACSHYF_15840 [Verrucomicrobiaceae bacterium]
MTASKEIKRGFAPVIVDYNNDRSNIPAALQKALPGGSIPHIVLMDPAMTKAYGSYNHAQLKGQDYRSIFKDAKKAATIDIKAGKFVLAPVEEKPAEEPKKEAVAKAAAADKKPAPKSVNIIEFEEPALETWHSSKGQKFIARLTAVENEKTFVFHIQGGRTVRAKADQLRHDSALRAKKRAGLQ